MIKRILSSALRALVASGLTIATAHAQFLPGVFGLGSSAAQAETAQPAQPAAAPQGLVPQPQVPAGAFGVATPVISPAAPRDQLVVVAPAAPGRVFGSQLFGGTFRGTLNHGFNPDYVIAIGDRLNVRLWGAFNFDGNLTVDQQGNVFIPNVGPVAVAGVKSGELNAVMERAIRRVYRSNTGIYAALDASQPVKVYVTGFVRQPGLYGGLASDSPISYLDKAGGVDQERGSYVDILVKRGNTVRKRINLYSFLLDGTLDIVQFQDGDIIVVGPRQHTFRVDGEVFNAYDFEFADAAIPLARALAMAKPKPGVTHVSIVRRQGAERRSEYHPIADIANVVINDGDSVTVTSDRYVGTIQVRVEGAHSGEHAIVLPYGAKLKDVLAQIRPNPMSRLDAMQLYRKSVQARQKEMLAVALRKVEEAALSARSKTAEEAGLRTREAELIMKFVERAKQIEPRGQVVLDQAQKGETLLEDGDVIVIPERTSLVMVHGEVVFPNAVSWKTGSTIEDYIRQAGGFTQGADTSKIIRFGADGATELVDGSVKVAAGDEIMVLPRIETKSFEVTRSLTQILYQIAFSAKVAFGL